MSAKLVVTLLATSLLTVGCVAYTDDPYYRGGYGYHDYDDDRYDRNDGRRYSEWERKRWEERKDYMNNNAKIFVNSKRTVVNGKNDTVNGRRNA